MTGAMTSGPRRTRSAGPGRPPAHPRSRAVQMRQAGRLGALPSDDMRFTTAVVFGRFIGACGVGSYLGAAIAGALAVVTGRAFAPGSSWLLGVPFLALIGAVLVIGVAWLTRYWLLPRVRRRLLWGSVAGLVLTPLAVAFGQLGDLATVGLVPVVAGAVTTAVLWVRWFNRSRRVRRSQAYAPQRS